MTASQIDTFGNIVISSDNEFVSTVSATSAAAVQVAHSIFNPAGSGKTLYVRSIQVAVASGGQDFISWVTVDPAYANVNTPVSLRLGSGNVSIASATFLNAAAAGTGTTIANIGNGGNTVTEALSNGSVITIPPGNGIIIFITTSTNKWQSTVKYKEL